MCRHVTKYSVAWLKVMHRNLRVAASGGLGSTKCICMARGCGEDENQEHLVECQTTATRSLDHYK